MHLGLSVQGICTLLNPIRPNRFREPVGGVGRWSVNGDE